jgi:hypothetical protein
VRRTKTAARAALLQGEARALAGCGNGSVASLALRFPPRELRGGCSTANRHEAPCSYAQRSAGRSTSRPTVRVERREPAQRPGGTACDPRLSPPRRPSARPGELARPVVLARDYMNRERDGMRLTLVGAGTHDCGASDTVAATTLDALGSAAVEDLAGQAKQLFRGGL